MREMKCVYLIVPLLHFTFSEFQVVGPPGPLIALAGSDLVLPCSVQPSVSAVDMNINWTRADLKNNLVHVYKDHGDKNDDQDPSYRGRTALSEENLRQGNASLLLSKVRRSDEGKYMCFIRASSEFGDYSVEVRVEAIGTHPLITVESYESSGGVSLVCVSKGWWPKPDLQWLDSDGANVIGVTETDKDTGSFSVKHRITVHNSASNKYYCRVKQRHHMMEAEIIISDQMFRDWKTKVAWITVIVLAAVGLIGFIIWRERRQNQKRKKERKQKQQQMEEERRQKEEQMDEERRQKQEQMEREARRQEHEERERVQKVQTYLSRRGLGRLRGAKLSPAQWSVVEIVLLNSKEDLDEFDLRKYDPSEECLLKLLSVVKASRKAVLEGCNITKEGCAGLFKFLKSNPSSHLRELNLNDNKPGEPGVKELSDLLEDPLCKLEKLQLCSCSITGEDCATLVKALQSNPSHLRDLNLNINKPGDSGVKLLSELLKNPQCKLEKLQLEGCSITDEGCAALFKGLKSNPSHMRELNLNNNKPEDSAVKLLSDLLEDPQCKLEKLQLQCCSVTEEGCAALVKVIKSNPSHLKELNLSYNEPGEPGVKELSDLLKSSHCKLETLQLAGCRITDEGCAALCKALKSNSSSQMRELNLNYNKPGQSGVKKLSDLLEDPHCKLETLQLERCSITDEGCAALVKALKSNPSSHLRELDLNYNEPGDSGVKKLSDLLKNSYCKLEKLELCYCSITDEGCAALVKALKSNSSSRLRELNLNSNKPGDSGVKELSDLLEDPLCKLETLQLSDCSFTVEGCAALVKALKSNPLSHLRELNLNRNKPGESGVKELSDLLEDPHCKLEKLELERCSITDEGCAALASALKSNSSTLRELNLSFNNPGQSGMKELSDLLEDPHCKLEKLHIQRMY
ncbi:hypothetical protein SRHO_G00141160 [Serrasalmus rhombeus]